MQKAKWLGVCLPTLLLFGSMMGPTVDVRAQESQPTVDTSDSVQMQRQLETITVIHTQILGSKFKARNRTGSAYYISPSELQRIGTLDINRILGGIPGVHVYEEDGYGLRPNISLRGTKAERSERISIMEDGILASPAPYSAPAAYYFPNVARMHAVEVLKGSSQIQYGPFTTGGAINLVSTPIPDKLEGEARFTYGMNKSLRGYARIGDKKAHWGYLVEGFRYQSDGFKHYTNTQPVKGFYRNDIIGKVVWHNGDEANYRHSLQLKAGFADEVSDETYLGLTEMDYGSTPYVRYLGSQMDQMASQHYQVSLMHLIEPTHKMSINTQLYYNHFHRNWYKLNDVRVGDQSDEKRSISSVLQFPETLTKYLDIVTGRKDTVGEALMVRANNRSYHSAGIQTRMEYRYKIRDVVYMTSELGLRYHHDSEDRYQHDDGYSIVGGVMELFRAGEPGSQSNRITSAQAFAGYFQTKMQWNDFTVNMGVRYEDVQLLKRDFGKRDPYRTGARRQEVQNIARAWIPSVGVSYQPYRFLTLLAGVHKGFAPPSAELFQKAESSTNTEIGARFNYGSIHAEVIGFFNAYSNMLGSDLTAAGGQGTLEQFNVGAADVCGFEMLLQLQLLPSTWKVKVPIQVQYTYTNTEMKNSFQSPAWGVVSPGDEIPYVYKHAASGNIGIEYGAMEFNLSARFKGDTRSEPGQSAIADRAKIPNHCVLDANAKYKVGKYVTFTINAVNLANTTYLASRHPSGLRPGHPLGIYGGVILKF